MEPDGLSWPFGEAPPAPGIILNGSGVLSERLIGSGGATQWTDYLFAGGGVVGMRVEHSVSGVYTRYFHKDHLGSIATITNEAGAVVERLSYDAWGKRRNPDGTDDPSGSIASQTTRGFTGHEELADVGLVHMNGRVYDPMLGRFGAPDPMTESPFSTQGWNRYTYVGNSPTNFTDPSGFCWAGCFWQAPAKALGAAIRRTPILGNILTVAAAAICTPAGLGPVCGALASAAVTGLASGDIGAALKAGAIAIATAVAFNFAGDLTSGLPVANIAAHAAIGCGVSVASGGKCGSGAASGAVGSFASQLTEGLDFTPRLIATSVAGGLASVAGGGKFGNGAVTAAFGYLFNSLAHCARSPSGCNDAFATAEGSGGQFRPGFGSGGAGLAFGAGIASQWKAVTDWLFGGLSESTDQGGVATIYRDGDHVSIEVRSNAESLQTGQVHDRETGMTRVELGGGGSPILTINLPRAQSALAYASSMVGQDTGPYNLMTNSCVTYCGDVLRAGGVEVPRNTRDLMKHFGQTR